MHKFKFSVVHNGEEYQSFERQQYLKAHETIHQITCSNTLHQNFWKHMKLFIKLLVPKHSSKMELPNEKIDIY